MKCERCGTYYSSPGENWEVVGLGVVERIGRDPGERCGDSPPGSKKPCDGRVWPTESEQQRSLADALVDNSLLPKLKAGHFLGRRRRLLLMMQVMYEKGTVVDAVSIADALRCEAEFDVQYVASLPIERAR